VRVRRHGARNLAATQLTYENYPFVLDTEIRNRRRLNRPFLETEMWYLLYNLVRAGNKFEAMGKKVGDINPHNVLINDNGQIKAIAVCSMPNELDNFQKVVEDGSARVFLGTC
jgi:serine/threonine protein kinase